MPVPQGGDPLLCAGNRTDSPLEYHSGYGIYSTQWFEAAGTNILYIAQHLCTPQQNLNINLALGVPAMVRRLLNLLHHIPAQHARDSGWIPTVLR